MIDKITRVVLALAATMALTGAAAAQDAQYWTQQMGNRARLLGGAMIGSASDMSAVFYNPGALALIEDPELLLAGNVIDYSSLTVKNALGIGDDATWSSYRWVPSLFAGELTFGWLGKNRLAYSLLTRQYFQTLLEDREARTNLLTGAPAASFDIQLDEDLTEYWTGFTWARPLGHGLGVGASMFAAIRNQRARYQGMAQALSASGQAAVVLDEHDFNYQHGRLLWKLGLGWEKGNWTAGLTVTTPSLGLFGSGATGLTQTAVGLPQVAPVTVGSYQDDLPAYFRSPLSVGVGASRALGRHRQTRLHVAAEWFESAGNFKVLDAAPVSVPGYSGTVSSDVTYGLLSLANIAVGIEHQKSYRVKVYAGFHTDFSGAEAGSNSTLSTWNIYDVSGGIALKVGRSDVTMGGVYGWGSAPIRPAGLIPPEVHQPALPEPDATYRQFTILLGFNFPYAKKVK